MTEVDVEERYDANCGIGVTWMPVRPLVACVRGGGIMTSEL